MPTAAQIRANRANAQRSTGPRTEAGRQITKFNALRHGLAAKDLIIPGEDPAVLDALRAELRAEYQPGTQTEAMLVEDLAVCWWRLQRARQEEADMLRGVVLANKLYDSPVVDGALRYTAAAERSWNRALANLRAAVRDRQAVEDAIADPAPAPQPSEPEKVMAIGSVLQNEPDTPPSAEVPAGEPAILPLTTDCCPASTEIGSVPQNEAEKVSQSPVSERGHNHPRPFQGTPRHKTASVHAEMHHFLTEAQVVLASCRQEISGLNDGK